jgi:hypothetical protein
MKFLISESEKQEILKLYGVISEQQSIAYEASTDKTPMYNYPKKNLNSSNQKNGGLPGDAKMENYLFQTTLGDIKKRAVGEQSQFFAGFKPTTDQKKYVDYLSIGNVVLQGGGTKEFDLTDPKSVVVASHNGLLALLRLMDAMKSTPGGIKAKVEMGTVDTRTSGVGVVSPEKAYQIWRIKDTVIELTSISMVSGYDLVNSPYKKSNLFKNKAYVDLIAGWAKLPKTGPNPPTTEQIANALVRNMDGQIFRILTKEEDSKREEFMKEFKLSTYIGADNLKNLINTSYNKTVNQVQPSLDEVLNLIRPAYIKMYTDFTRKYYPDNSNELVEIMNSKINDKPKYNLKDQVALYSRTDVNLAPGQTQSAQNTSTKTVQSREIGK